MACSPPGSSVHGILQARIREWVAVPFSRGSSWPRNWSQVSCIAGRFFTTASATRQNLPIKPRKLHTHLCVLSRFSRVQLCNPKDHSLPGSFVHGINQARTLEWVVVSSFRGSSLPRDWTWVSSASCIACTHLASCNNWGKLSNVSNPVRAEFDVALQLWKVTSLGKEGSQNSIQLYFATYCKLSYFKN